jgi:hypothetical protein
MRASSGPRLVGLGDVVVGPGLQPHHLVDRVVARGHHDDADPLAALAQVAGEGKAVLAARQPQVEQHQGRRILLDEFAQSAAVLDARGAIALVVQEVDQRFALNCSSSTTITWGRGSFGLVAMDPSCRVHATTSRMHPDMKTAPGGAVSTAGGVGRTGR